MKALRIASWVSFVTVTVLAFATTDTQGQASVYGLTIPSGHPRLWWTAERIARARTWYQSNQFSPRQGTAEDRALDNALLYVLTGNAQNCRTALDNATSIIINDRAANSPTEGVSSGGMRWSGEHVILTYDWCHSQMTQSDRDTLLNRWNFYLENIRQHAWGNAQMYESNYNWGYMRNMIEWGITTYGENPMADRFLSDGIVNRWQNNFVPFANTAGRGGVWQEGSNYGSAIPDYSTVPFVTAGLLGRNLYAETNYQRENIYFLIHTTTPARTHHRRSGESNFEMFPFADDERFGDGGFLNIVDGFGNFMTVMSDMWRNVAHGAYARRWLNMVQPPRSRHVRALDTGSPERDFSNLPLDYFAVGPAYLFGRNQWGPQSTAWHLQLGLSNDLGHSHNDLGNWQIWRRGRWLSRETTGYAMNIAGFGGSGSVDANNAVAHNGLLVNGAGGESERGTPGQNTARYSVRALESKSDYTYAAVNLSPAYSSRATRVQREFVFIRSLETMVILDRLESGSPKTFLAHFEQNPSVDQSSRVINAVNGDQALRMSTLLPADVSYRVVTEGSEVGQYRVEATSSAGGQTYFLNVLQAKGANDANLTTALVDSGTSYTLTLTDAARGTAILVFQKGMSAAGGTITVQGQIASLASTVDTMGLTDNGPAWGAGAGPRGPSAPTSVRIIR